MDEPRRRNPFRNEADAFRVLLIVVAGAIAVMVSAAVAGPTLWIPVALILIALGIRSTLLWLQGGLGAPPPVEGEGTEPVTDGDPNGGCGAPEQSSAGGDPAEGRHAPE
jgi:hypothetical protein